MLDSVNKLAHRSVLGLTIAFALFGGVAVLSGSVATAQQTDDSGPDPADANLAPSDGSQPQDQLPNQQAQQPQDQQQQLQPSTGGAPVYRAAPPPSGQPQDQSQQPDQNAAPTDQQDTDGSASYNPNYEDQVDAGQAALDEEASEPPPALPTYDQPEAPGPNYIWTPGYWGFAPAGYYWVPGVWCSAPYYGALWTPGYWYFNSGYYRFHHGYWGPYIGFYGGINYGFGYTGFGYYGGYWTGNHFYYNTAVNRVNVNRVSFVYRRNVVVANHTRIAYNGGHGGLTIHPRPAELTAMRQTRTPPMTMQLQNQRSAASDRQQFYNQNRGRPAITAAPRPIAADRGIQRPATRPAYQSRPAQPNMRPNQPQVRPDQPFTRPNQPNVRPEAPQTRPAQPQVQPRPDVRPQQPRPEQPRPEQPRPQQPHYEQPRPQQSQPRPQSQPHSEPHQNEHH